ncbi:MAG: hypothetical protein D5R98_03255 [Desulfonatronovibrio sp. MSAO_Bac4]|nr:MAG: hypothetical protein D5R98_03255 [Desulfonatronovibrio sp. MSAO_Bac4]
MNFNLWTLDLVPWTLDLRLWTLDLGPWTLDFSNLQPQYCSKKQDTLGVLSSVRASKEAAQAQVLHQN